ncbi:dihydroxyacetone kinase subunit L [Chloroflexota bacterium]
MSELSLDAELIKTLLNEVAADLKSHSEDLRQLDAKIGDGDLGVTAELSSKAISEYLAIASETDIGKLLAQCGMNINKVSPSTFGTVLASAFMGGGKAVMGKTQLEVNDLVLLGEGAIENIQKRGKAEAGDKTVLDTIVPAVAALKRELESGTDTQTAISAAVKAAEDGMIATIDMKAKFGRAKWFQDSSIGVQDGGATAMYYMIRLFGQRLLP